MPATIRRLENEQLARRVSELGRQIRQRRKVLGVTATSAAEAAGMSRVTWYRIEKGQVSVTIGAWFNALAVLGLDFGIGHAISGGAVSEREVDSGAPLSVPVEIALRDYPQLRALAWQISEKATVTPREALDIYQRNRRFIDFDDVSPQERALIEALGRIFGEPDLV